MKFKKYLEELRKLNLPENQYAVFGSGPMAVRGIRDSGDLDIVVKSELWKNLSSQYPPEGDKIVIGNIEIYRTWNAPFYDNVAPLIERAEMIEGIKFVRLEDVVKWKKEKGREKDKIDIELINRFFVKQF